MLVVVVDFGDIAVGDDNVGEVAQSLDPVGEADGEKGEGEARRREKGFGGQWRAAMSTKTKEKEVSILMVTR